jgi:hypothetical protein
VNNGGGRGNLGLGLGLAGRIRIRRQYDRVSGKNNLKSPNKITIRISENKS